MISLGSVSYRGSWEARWGGTDLPGLATAVPHHLGVDGAGNAVVLLDVQLWELVYSVHRSFIDILDSSRFHNVTDLELLDGLVLGDAATTVGAADGFHMSTSVLGASVITAF